MKSVRNPIVAIAACFIAASSVGHAATVIRGFEDQSQGAFLNEYPEFTVSTDTAGGTLFVYTWADFATEGTNFLVVTDPASGGAATGNAIFTATAGNSLEGVSFNGMENAADSVVATISLYNGATSLGSVNLLAPGVNTTPVQLDFTSYGTVTRFEVRNITDAGGFAIDRIVVNTAAAVPEVSSWLSASLAGVLLLGRRKRR